MEHGDDGLPVSIVGEWALEKHERLRRYVTITGPVRRKWLKPMRAGFVAPGATYIDLFCGPGRSRIRDTDQIIDGSPLVAAGAAANGGTPFSRVLLADLDETCVDAARARLAELGITSEGFTGPASETASKIAGSLEPRGLHFAFIDPFNLGDLPFAAIKHLARLSRMDMLIHVSVQDLQRNLRRYVDQEGSPLDLFAPGWRDTIDVLARGDIVRTAIFNYWLKLLRGLDLQPSPGVELVRGEQSQRLYWLILVSRHERADQLWGKIRNITKQGRLL